MALRYALLLVALVSPQVARAHPHEFIDATLQVLLNDQGQALGVQITWVYDPLTTLMILEALQMDRDFDAVLTADETAQLQGFDMDWETGFDGDTYALLGTTPVPMGPPTQVFASYGQEQLTSRHTRMFAGPLTLGAQALIVQSYDPEYYTAYTVVDATLQGGPGCKVQVYTPDLSAADIAMQAALEQYGPNDDPEANFPRVGAAYAEEARVTCPAP